MERVARLARMLADEGVGAYLVTAAPTMRYLFGWAEEGGMRLLAVAVGPGGGVRAVAPALAAEQARRAGIADIDAWADEEGPDAAVRRLADDWGLDATVVAVDNETRAEHLLRLQSLLPKARFVEGRRFVSRQMRQKDRAELAAMRKAARIADDSLEPVLARLRPGVTEAQTARMLADEMAARGGEPAFGIVASGAHGAEPHHAVSDAPLQRGAMLILDYGCTVDGYHSDTTRTVALGEAGDAEREAYAAVARAHFAARAAIRPGVRCGAVDSAARETLAAAGLADRFVHRTGHGIGLRIHEEPFIVGGSEVELLEGDCFSVEPGVYVPGRFGVRIENIVSVTGEGHESLNRDPEAELRTVPFGD